MSPPKKTQTTPRKSKKTLFRPALCHPPILALSGGIASGKSTVASIFKNLGATTIYADEEAKKLYAPGTALFKKILKRYGKSLSTSLGIDRKKLAAIVFNKPQEKYWLEEQTHHLTRKKIGQKIRQALYQKKALILVEAALHIETGYDQYFPGLILVTAKEKLRLKRLMEREFLSLKEAKLRLKNQLPFSKTKPHATWIIDNSKSLKETEKQVKALYKKLIKNKIIWLKD